MEGLIPMIYKSLKRSKTFRQRKEPRSSPIQNIEDFYPDGYNFVYTTPQAQQYPKIKSFYMKSKYMQRCHHAGGKYWLEEPVESQKKIIRLGSQRSMFSCITGAA